MSKIQIISEFVIPTIGVIILYIVYPLIKQKIGNEKMQEIMIHANILFNAAEEIFNHRHQGVKKHEFVKNELMEKKGITADEADIIIKALATEYNKIIKRDSIEKE